MHRPLRSLLRTGSRTAYSPWRASVTGRRALGTLLRTSARRHRQGWRPCLVCCRCAHLLAALGRPDGATDLAVSGSVRYGYRRYHGCLHLNFLSAGLVVAREGMEIVGEVCAVLFFLLFPGGRVDRQ